MHLARQALNPYDAVFPKPNFPREALLRHVQGDVQAYYAYEPRSGVVLGVLAESSYPAFALAVSQQGLQAYVASSLEFPADPSPYRVVLKRYFFVTDASNYKSTAIPTRAEDEIWSRMLQSPDSPSATSPDTP
jgi:hypothetical protein